MPADSNSAAAPPDERLVPVGLLTRLLARPDIGALLGAIAVWLAFGYFARDVNWMGDPAIAAGWTDQAAQYGIVAVPVALLMIGGEFDLSAGVDDRQLGPAARLPDDVRGHQHLAGDRGRAAVRARRRPRQRRHRGEDAAAELHRHARDVLRAAGRERGGHAER